MNKLEIIELAIQNKADCILTVEEESDIYGLNLLTRCFIDGILSTVTYRISYENLENLKTKLAEVVDVPKNSNTRKNSKPKN